MSDQPRRPTLAELAAGSQDESLSMAGKPAVSCPYCGAAMFVMKTIGLSTRVDRYETCRNCGRRFLTRQPQKVIVREVKPNDDEISSDGKLTLTVLREAG